MPMVTSGGHFGPVLDLAWQPGAGQFVVTISGDQTARLHSYWSATDDRQVGEWSGCFPAREEFHREPPVVQQITETIFQIVIQAPKFA